MTRTERKKARRRERFATDPEHRAQVRTQWNAWFKAKRASDPAWAAEYKRKASERNRRWAAANRERRRILAREQGRRRRARDPERWREMGRQWRAANPERAYELQRRGVLKRFGISMEDYRRFHTEQDGKCAVCKNPSQSQENGKRVRSLQVDHDHITGVVRGLLCTECNLALGKLREDPARIRALADYIERFKGGR